MDSEIFTVRPDGRSLRQLTHNSVDDRDPAWSPDGHAIAFARVVGDDNEFSEQNTEIFVMRADGSNVRRLTVHAGEDDQPAWSPDGSTVCC